MIRQLSFFVLLFSRSCSGYHVTEHCKETLKNAVNEYLYHYRDSRTKKDLQLYFRYQPFFFIVEILEKYLRVLQRITNQNSINTEISKRFEFFSFSFSFS